MSIENISRIYAKNNNTKRYLFDVPTIEDENAMQSYILTSTKGKISIEKLTDFNAFLCELKTCKAKEIKPESKNYKTFLLLLKKYIELNRYNEFMDYDEEREMSENDLLIIKKHYREELKNRIKIH